MSEVIDRTLIPVLEWWFRTRPLREKILYFPFWYPRYLVCRNSFAKTGKCTHDKRWKNRFVWDRWDSDQDEFGYARNLRHKRCTICDNVVSRDREMGEPP